MIELIQKIWKTPELRLKLLVVFGLLVVFRFAAAIPVPGIDTSKVAGFIQSNQIFGLLNLFTGGSLESFSIVMLGVGPYITATIIFQLLTMIFPKLKKMYYEEGERGRQRFNQYARIITVPLAMLQAYSFLRLLDLIPQIYLGYSQLILNFFLTLFIFFALFNMKQMVNGIDNHYNHNMKKRKK